MIGKSAVFDTVRFKVRTRGLQDHEACKVAHGPLSGTSVKKECAAPFRSGNLSLQAQVPVQESLYDPVPLVEGNT